MQVPALGKLRKEMHRVGFITRSCLKKQTETKGCYGKKRFFDDHQLQGQRKMYTVVIVTSLVLFSRPADLQIQPSLDLFPME